MLPTTCLDWPLDVCFCPEICHRCTPCSCVLLRTTCFVDGPRGHQLDFRVDGLERSTAGREFGPHWGAGQPSCCRRGTVSIQPYLAFATPALLFRNAAVKPAHGSARFPRVTGVRDSISMSLSCSICRALFGLALAGHAQLQRSSLCLMGKSAYHWLQFGSRRIFHADSLLRLSRHGGNYLVVAKSYVPIKLLPATLQAGVREGPIPIDFRITL